MEDQAQESVHFTYVDAEGQSHRVGAAIGETLMKVATLHSIAGIGGDCGGNCACGTCHVVIESALAEKLRPHESAEADLLEFIGHSPARGHRLGCQVAVTREFDGAVITVQKPI